MSADNKPRIIAFTPKVNYMEYKYFYRITDRNHKKYSKLLL